MRTFTKALLAITAFSLAPPAHAADPKPLSVHKSQRLSDTQLREAVAYIEQTIELPEGSEPLDTLGRYYAQRKGVVHAVYTASFWWGLYSPGAHIVARYNQLPRIKGRGCGVIDVVYIPSTQAIKSTCHGEA